MKKKKVLVLNSSHSPLQTCSWRKAIKLVHLKKVMMIEETGEIINESFSSPSIIRLIRYIHLPYRNVVLNRKNLMLRDNFTCQYCGRKENLTIDHVVPKSRGGKDSWRNTVVACHRCNNVKGNSTVEEAGYKLKARPIEPPSNLYLEITRNTHYPKKWRDYFF